MTTSKNIANCVICNKEFNKCDSLIKTRPVCSEFCLGVTIADRIEKYKITRRDSTTGTCEVCNSPMVKADSVMTSKYVCSIQCKNIRKRTLPKKESILSTSYYIKRGFTEKESIEIISNIQKERSPRSIDYWLKAGLTTEDSHKKISEHQKSIAAKNNMSKNERQIASPRSIHFWLSRGYSPEESKNKQREFNDSSSIEYFVKKYGQEDGIKLYQSETKRKSYASSLTGLIEKYGKDEGTDIWLKKYKNRESDSKIAKQFFMELYNRLPLEIKSLNIYFKGLTEKEYGIKGKSSYYFYDFVIPELKFCIEFNGAYWHADPTKYKRGDTIVISGKEILVDDIWEHDLTKKRHIEKRGFLLRTVWSRGKKMPVENIELLTTEIISLYKELKK